MMLFPRMSVLAALLVFAWTMPAFARQPAGTPPVVPNPKLTPGDTLDVTLADIQERGYSAKVRNVPVSVKREVYAAYGITTWKKGEYEVDHLVALSLGGSNNKKNLWPESYLTEPWNAHTKDQLEYRLLTLVRSGKVDMKVAQQEMATDWIAAYRKYVSPEPLTGKTRRGKLTGKAAKDKSALKDEDPDTDTTPPATAATSPAVAGDEKVWVNTKSKVIWKPGSQYYGKTKEGKYMNADDAIKAGYRFSK